ncbi:MAG: PAS domain-containing protein [Archangiaceae bacterium]|nr:PAS domain-containing protein [Archangiaceae bacterium]
MLANLIETQFADLVTRWVERVQRRLAAEHLERSELEDHVPSLLRELMVHLRREESAEQSSAARTHGEQRYRLGFDLSSVVAEYGLLRGVIFEVLERGRATPSLHEARVLGDFFSTAVAESVTEHARRQLECEVAAKAALQESEQRYRALLDGVDDGYCLLQLSFDANDRPIDYRFVETNSAFEHQSGLQHPLGKTARELVPDLDPSWFERYGEVALTGTAVRFESYVPAMARWFDVFATRVGEPHQRLVAVIFRDITANVRAEEQRAKATAEAKESEAQLQRMIAQAPAAACLLVGPEHRFRIANPLYQTLVSGRAVVGKTVAECVPEIADQGFVGLLDTVRKSGAPFIGRETAVMLQPEHGAPYEVRLNFVYQPILDARGEVESIFVLAVDVTDLVRARERAEQLERVAAERAAFEQQLIGIVSHDLRNPLGTIGLAAQTMLRNEALDDRSLKQVVRVRGAYERALRLVEDLLDFTQARLGGGIQIERRPMDLARALPGWVDEACAAHPEREVRVEVEGDATGSWDEDRIAQVVSNLVSNALKYGDTLSPVQVRVNGKGADVLLEVSNHGPPISAEMQERLFEPMQRGAVRPDVATRSVGLGLFIVKHLIEAHGGSVSLRSDAEATTFTVRLPR